jgi:hypothetical protein
MQQQQQHQHAAKRQRIDSSKNGPPTMRTGAGRTAQQKPVPKQRESFKPASQPRSSKTKFFEVLEDGDDDPNVRSEEELRRLLGIKQVRLMRD